MKYISFYFLQVASTHNRGIFEILFASFMLVGFLLIYLLIKRKIREKTALFVFIICLICLLSPMIYEYTTRDNNKKKTIINRRNNIIENPYNNNSQNDNDWLIGTWICNYWMESTATYPGQSIAPIRKKSVLILKKNGVAYYEGERTTYRLISDQLLIKDPETPSVNISIPIDYNNKKLYFGKYKSSEFYYYKE